MSVQLVSAEQTNSINTTGLQSNSTTREAPLGIAANTQSTITPQTEDSCESFSFPCTFKAIGSFFEKVGEFFKELVTAVVVFTIILPALQIWHYYEFGTFLSLPDGDFDITGGYHEASDGTQTLADGTIILPDGTVIDDFRM